MQIEFKGAQSPHYHKTQKHVTAKAPGFVSTTSWSDGSIFSDDTARIQKGRVVTPPPATGTGLHQLMREAFWLD